MAQKINPIPKGYRTATPALVVRNAAAALDYYAMVFGATEMSRLFGEDGTTIVRAEIKIGNSILHLSDEQPAVGILSPLSLAGTSSSVQLFLEDLNGSWDRAVESDATVLLPLEDKYWGERTGSIVDVFGHVWTLSKRVEAVSKAELEKRVRDLFGPAAEDVSLETAPEAEDIPTIDIRSLNALTNEVPTSDSVMKH